MILFWQRSRMRRGDTEFKVQGPEVPKSRTRTTGRRVSAHPFSFRCDATSNAHNANNANNALASLKSVDNGGMTTIRKLRSRLRGGEHGAKIRRGGPTPDSGEGNSNEWQMPNLTVRSHLFSRIFGNFRVSREKGGARVYQSYDNLANLSFGISGTKSGVEGQ